MTLIRCEIARDSADTDQRLDLLHRNILKQDTISNMLPQAVPLAISLPTMLVGFARYSRDDSFTVLARNRSFVLVMALGSVIGVAIGGQLLGIVPEVVLLPVLVTILLVSSVKVWRHG